MPFCQKDKTKRLRLVIFLIAGTIGTSLSAKQINNFDQQIPGQSPAGWSHAWGNQSDDQLLVTNLRAASGQNSMLIDRLTSTNTAQWGIKTYLPQLTNGWLQISFSFCIEGAGTQAHLGMEFRNGYGSKRAMGGGFRLNHLSFSTYAKDVPKELQKADLGDYQPDTWYRLVFLLPGPKEERTAYVQLFEILPDGSTQPLQKPQPLVCEVLQGKAPSIMLNIAPGRRGVRFFIDDISYEHIQTTKNKETTL
jgi:hypothetical protein